MYVRFVVTRKLGRGRFAYGLFTAANDLLEDGEPSAEDRQELESLIDWFNRKLPVPASYWQDERAIYWYKPGAKEHIRKMWELANLLKLYD